MDLSELKTFEEQQSKVGKLTLSQAMRIGARLRPQCKGYMFVDGASCALGAIYEATFGKTFERSPDRGDSQQRYALDELFAIYPQLKAWSIWARNDTLGWSREQIADWLAEQGL